MLQEIQKTIKAINTRKAPNPELYSGIKSKFSWWYKVCPGDPSLHNLHMVRFLLTSKLGWYHTMHLSIKSVRQTLIRQQIFEENVFLGRTKKFSVSVVIRRNKFIHDRAEFHSDFIRGNKRINLYAIFFLGIFNK